MSEVTTNIKYMADGDVVVDFVVIFVVVVVNVVVVALLVITSHIIFSRGQQMLICGTKILLCTIFYFSWSKLSRHLIPIFQSSVILDTNLFNWFDDWYTQLCWWHPKLLFIMKCLHSCINIVTKSRNDTIPHLRPLSSLNL